MAPVSSGASSVFPLDRPGILLDFISCPVIKGFTSAAAITIGFGQVKVSTSVDTGTPARWQDRGPSTSAGPERRVRGARLRLHQ